MTTHGLPKEFVSGFRILIRRGIPNSLRNKLVNQHLHAVHATVSFILSVAALVELYYTDLAGYDVASYPLVFWGFTALMSVTVIVLLATHEHFGLRT